MEPSDYHTMILVPGHATLLAGTDPAAVNVLLEKYWVLQPFQAGELPMYSAHCTAAMELARIIPDALIVFSGTWSRAESGEWSEAASYAVLARKLAGSSFKLEPRILLEEYARDSFENLLFGLCRFIQHTGHAPVMSIVAGWAFKEPRFDTHRFDLHLPIERFKYKGVNNPADLATAEHNEAATLETFRLHPFGLAPELVKKRLARNPRGVHHPYADVKGMREFFEHYDRNDAALEQEHVSFPW